MGREGGVAYVSEATTRPLDEGVLRTLRGGGGPCGDLAVSGMRERLRFQGTNAGEGCLLYLFGKDPF